MARGIAAVTDAVFLLLIAAIASGIILSAASNYGKSFELQSQKLLMNYYAKQVVRSIVTASIYREDAVPDYLLSYLKENFETLKNIGKAEEKLEEVIRKAMKPIEQRYDYAVILDTLNTTFNTAYIFYKLTNENGNQEEGKCSTQDGASLADWFDSLGSEVYTSSTTIFLRSCISGSCTYVPADIRVVVFPRARATDPPC